MPEKGCGTDEAATAGLVALATGAWRQTVLAVAARLDLCAMLGTRAADLEEVCYSLGTQRLPMRYFLAACAGLGLVEERDAAYALGPLGQALLAEGGAGLAAWAEASSDQALAAALTAVLVEPLLVAPGAPPGATSAVGQWDGASGGALHALAAAALAAELPLEEEGLALEVGGQGVFVRALLARAAGLRGGLVADASAAGQATLAGCGQREAAVTAASGGRAIDERLVVLPTLEGLEARRAHVAVVVQAADGGGAAALRKRLTDLRPYLAPGAWVAVVGPFLAAGPVRPLAPLLALLALAAGRSAWCPPVEVVAEHLRASGYAPTRTLVLPEPDVALLARG